MPAFPPALFLENVIRLACAMLPYPNTPNAHRFLLAVAKQESGLKARFQELNPGTDKAGAAKGWFQFEPIGVENVLTHPKTKDQIADVLDALRVMNSTGAVHRAIEGHDILSACVARCLLWQDPDNIPFDEQGAWEAYLKLWRPGKPDRARWTESWRVAIDNVPLS